MKRPAGSNPLNLLVAEYNFFKPDSTDKQIAHILMNHVSQIPNMTIEQAADCCNISVSTCRRFIKSLGFSTYAEFRMMIADSIRRFDFDTPPEIETANPEDPQFFTNSLNGIREDLSLLENSLDHHQIRRIAQAMAAHQRIFIHDLLKSGMRLPLMRNLVLSGKEVTLSYDPGSQEADAAQAGPDCLYLMNYDGHLHAGQIPNTIKAVKKKGAAVVILSNQRTFPDLNLCDAAIIYPKGDSTVSAFLMLDLIYLYIGEMYKCLFVTGHISEENP